MEQRSKEAREQRSKGTKEGDRGRNPGRKEGFKEQMKEGMKQGRNETNRFLIEGFFLGRERGVFFVRHVYIGHVLCYVR